jgi:hypothetical protein
MAIHIEALFCCLDDFFVAYQQQERENLIPAAGHRQREGMLCLSEMMLIMTLFHLSAYKDFKHFYIYGIQGEYRSLFKEVPCYARFVQLIGRLLLPFSVLIQALRGEETGFYVADSTKLAVCDNHRISSNRVFKNLAKRGKTSMGWFYGFKLHVIINHNSEIMAVKITPGNTDDRKPLPGMTKGLKGKLFADKGYISKSMFKNLWKDGLQLITGIRKNMKNYLMPLFDKLMLRKRFILETVFGVLKRTQGLEHTRHRSPTNAFVHVLSCLIAYCLKPVKPRINKEINLKTYP